MAETETDLFSARLWEEIGGNTLLEQAPEVLRGSFSQSGDFRDAADGILRTLDGREVLSYLRETVYKDSGGFFALLGTLFGFLTISAIWRRYRDNLSAVGCASAFSLLTTTAAALICFGRLSDLLETFLSFSETVRTEMLSVTGALTVLYAVCGQTTAAAVASAGISLFLTVMETLCCSVLAPFVKLLCGLSAASVFDSGGTLGGLCSMLRKNFLWVMGAMMAVFSAVLSFQTILARSADSLTLRAVKFSFSSAIPVIGSALGEAASAVTAGISLTQKTVGGIGIAVILWQLLPPLVTLFGTKLAFSLAASAAELFSLDREKGILRETEALTGFLCAILSAEGVLYVLLISLCVNGG